MNTGAKEIQSILEELEELKLSHMAIDDDSWDIRTAFLNYPDKVLVTPGQDS